MNRKKDRHFFYDGVNWYDNMPTNMSETFNQVLKCTCNPSFYFSLIELFIGVLYIFLNKKGMNVTSLIVG